MDSQGTGDYNCQVLEDLWRNGVSRIICRMTMFTRTDLSLCHPYHTILVTNNRCERRREVEGAVHGGNHFRDLMCPLIAVNGATIPTND